MTELRTLVDRLSQKIKIWSASKSRLVVGIDGYAGSGKTTLADMVAKSNAEILVIHLDDFIRPIEDRKQMMTQANEKSKIFEFEWYRYDAIERLVHAFKAGQDSSYKEQIYSFQSNKLIEGEFDFFKNILIIEGIFLFHPSHAISEMFDKKIYISTDFDKADERRIARETERWGKDYVPETHPDNWTQHFKIAYRRYVKEFPPAEKADLAIEN